MQSVAWQKLYVFQLFCHSVRKTNKSKIKSEIFHTTCQVNYRYWLSLSNVSQIKFSSIVTAQYQVQYNKFPSFSYLAKSDNMKLPLAIRQSNIIGN